MPRIESFLDLEGLTVSDVETGADEYGEPAKFLSCISSNPRPKCPYCSSLNVYGNTNRIKKIRDLDSGGYRIFLNIKARNYKCNDCNRYFTEELPIVKPSGRYTKRFIELIGTKSLDFAYETVGGQYGISPSTASNIFREWVNDQDNKHAQHLYSPEVLGIDEAHLCPKGHRGPNDGMRGVFVDVKERKILDITKDRYKNTVVEWLGHMRESENLKIVTMDMWDGYRQAVYEVFGDRVKVVVDRFHVIQELIVQMQKVRNNIYEELPDGALRNHRNNLSLLKSNIEDLDDERKRQLNRLFEAVPDIKTCYALKESFRSIYRCKTRVQAEKAFTNWEAAIPSGPKFKPYKQVAKTVRKWHKEIFNYFDCGRVTNAVTESMNGIIKKINRMGNGYSFDVLRAKVLYGAGRSAYTPANPRTPVPNIPIPTHDSATSMRSVLITKTPDYNPLEEFNNEHFGVDMVWLEKEIDSGRFFRNGDENDD